MIQGILTFQFILNQRDTGEIEPEFKPIQLEFRKGEDKKFSKEDYSELIDHDDIFGIFYQHTTGIYGIKGGFSNFYAGRLKETPFQVISFFKQELDGSQFLALSVFELDDDIEMYEELIKKMAQKLDVLFETLIRAKSSRQLNVISNVNERIENELKLTIFQIDRLSKLAKLQKAALIFSSNERLEILKTLRENPISKRDMKNRLEKIKTNPNVDILLEPFLELNLVRRDWIKGQRDKRSGRMENQGEYLFLTKDIILTRVPNQKVLEQVKEKDPKSVLYENLREKVEDFYTSYDPLEQTQENVMKLASILLNPDIFDFINLMRNNYYPLDKIPKILSEWADPEEIIDVLQDLEIVTVIEDDKKRKWLFLLSDIKPMIIFPEYILPKIREAFTEKKITEEIAKKAYNLLEVTYPEKVEF